MTFLLALACAPKPVTVRAPAVYQVAVDALEDPLFVPEDTAPGLSRLDLLHRVNPIYPPEGADLSGERCVGEVAIGFDGIPSDVTVTACDEVFVAPTRAALLQWRWAPPRDRGEPVRGRTYVAVTYRLPASGD